MIKILLLVIAAIAGLIVGPELAGNQGYVLISLANHTLEMSFTTLIIAIVALFMALFILEFILRKVFSFTGATNKWMTVRKTTKSRALTQDGLLKLLEGDWKQAEKLVVKGAENSDAPLLNYLAAAEAAQHRGDVESRDHYLQQALELNSGNLATALTRAKLQFHQGQYEEALASLKGLQESNPKNKVLLTLLKDTHVKLNDWQSLVKLIPTLVRSNVLTDKDAAQLQLEAECGLISHISTQQGSAGLLKHWSNLPRNSKQQTALIGCLIKELIAQKADSEAYTILRDAIKKQPDESLLKLIPKLDLPDYHPVIIKLSELLRTNENQAVVHSTLGQLYLKLENWQLAKEHFEKAVEAKPDVADYARLVNSLEKLEDTDAAKAVSREALSVALPHKA